MAQMKANGANGTTNGDHKEVPVTKEFASFVAYTTVRTLTSEVKAKLKELLLDYVGVAYAASRQSESSEKIYKAIKALGGENGSNTVLCKGPKFTAPYAALLNGAFGHSFDFDDTHLTGVLHPGVAVIPAALAEAETKKSSGESLLLALAVGYEVTCRLGTALSDKSYARGFHNTGTAGIFGAVAAICKLRNLEPKAIEMAFGIAGSKAAGSMQYLENGSWNKRLHPGFAAHDAFTCVALAEAGVIGALKIFEGELGFLHAYTTNESIDYASLTHDLGLEWVFMSTALKPFPGCRMTHTAIEIAGKLRDTNRPAQEIDHITIYIKPECYLLVGNPIPNKIHPENEVDAQFSIYYQTAVALLDGSNTGYRAYSRLQDRDVHDLLDKITVEKDSSFKSMETRITIKWTDGKESTEFMEAPLGEESNPFSREKIMEKYMSLVSPICGEQRATQIVEVIDNVQRVKVVELMLLLS